ncbi:MAG: acyl-CoA dehydrogenase family protein [Sphingomonadaceae bacterium]|nr:acyl-CoA dehydrogenase family protein [Sphingomonadaceae bacterium]
MDFDWTADDVAYRNDVRNFLAEQLPPGWNGYDKHDLPRYKKEAKAFCTALAEKGWLTQSWPKEYGGGDASPWRAAILSEELWPIGEPRGSQYMNANWIGPAIMFAGTPEQKAYHIGRMSKGDVFWCQGFSEPDAGSDLPALRTRAVRDGDEYVINGSKIWTSHVGIADYIFLLVRTDPDAPKREGISILLFPIDTPGLDIRHIDGFVGEQAFHHLIFEDVRVPVSCRLGEENRGWPIVQRALSFERIGAAHYETARLILEDAVATAQRNGRIEDPEVQTRIGEVTALIEAARMLTYKVVDLRAQGLPPTADSNVARVAQTTALQEVGMLAADLHGSASLESGNDADVRNVLAYSVAAGATEMQLDQIASRWLDLPRSK